MSGEEIMNLHSSNLEDLLNNFKANTLEEIFDTLLNLSTNDLDNDLNEQEIDRNQALSEIFKCSDLQS